MVTLCWQLSSFFSRSHCQRFFSRSLPTKRDHGAKADYQFGPLQWKNQSGHQECYQIRNSKKAAISPSSSSTRPPNKVSNYRKCYHLTFSALSVRLPEVHVYRGWQFTACWEKVMYISHNDAMVLHVLCLFISNDSCNCYCSADTLVILLCARHRTLSNGDGQKPKRNP